MPTYTTRFREVKGRNIFRLKCTCGKRFQRVVSDYQTVNPFNKNEDGTLKTTQEVWQSIRESLEGKEPTMVCPGCDGTEGVSVVSQSGIEWVA